MNSVALVVMADSETPEGRGRMTHALHVAQELKEAGDEVRLIFDGIGVKWLDAFARRDHPFTQAYGPLFDAIREDIAGACDFCSTRFEVREQVLGQGYALLGEEGKHHGLRDWIAEGYQVLTF